MMRCDAIPHDFPTHFYDVHHLPPVTAEKLYLYLKTAGVHAFLDRKCLKNGEKWKDGFLNGACSTMPRCAVMCDEY